MVGLFSASIPASERVYILLFCIACAARCDMSIRHLKKKQGRIFPRSSLFRIQCTLQSAAYTLCMQPKPSCSIHSVHYAIMQREEKIVLSPILFAQTGTNKTGPRAFVFVAKEKKLRSCNANIVCLVRAPRDLYSRMPAQQNIKVVLRNVASLLLCTKLNRRTRAIFPVMHIVIQIGCGGQVKFPI